MAPRQKKRRAGGDASPDQPTAEVLRGFLDAPKALASPVEWRTDNRNLRFTVALDIDGITEPGLTLAGRASINIPDRHVSLLLVYRKAAGGGGCFERIDWLPLDVHTNTGRARGRLRFLQIAASHRHAWHLNQHLKIEEALDDLPIAEPLQPEPQTWPALLRLAGTHWRIGGLDMLPLSPWQASLLFAEQPTKAPGGQWQ